MRRILVASDHGPTAAIAVERAIRLAASQGADIRIVHAVEDGRDHGSIHGRIFTEASLMAEELTGLPIAISVRVPIAAPAEAILEEAAAFDADLLVLGAHGPPRFRDAVFGTTGTQVVRNSEVPVLIVQGEAATPYHRILAAIADLRSAPSILTAARAVSPGAELFALHALEPRLRQALCGEREGEKVHFALGIEKLLRALQAKAAPQRDSAGDDVIIAAGEATRLILEQAEKLKPDLLAMGSSRKSGFQSSHAVVALFWCRQDLLVVPQSERALLDTAAPAQALLS